MKKDFEISEPDEGSVCYPPNLLDYMQKDTAKYKQIKDLKRDKKAERICQLGMYGLSAFLAGISGTIIYQTYEAINIQQSNETDFYLPIIAVGLSTTASILTAGLGYCFGKDAKKTLQKRINNFD